MRRTQLRRMELIFSITSVDSKMNDELGPGAPECVEPSRFLRHVAGGGYLVDDALDEDNVDVDVAGDLGTNSVMKLSMGAVARSTA